MKRVGVLVDVFPVWSDMDERCLNAQQAEEFGTFGSGGSIGAIEQNAKFAEIGRDAGCERFDIGVTKSGLAGERGARDFQRGVVGGCGILEEREDFFFDGEFAGVTELESV